METREDILKELKEIAPQLALLEKVNAFRVPESYFLNFKHSILEQIKPLDAKQELAALAPVLQKLQKPEWAEPSAAYFSGFSTKILNKVRADEAAQELAAIAPKLSTLPKVNIYEAPVNYFKAFPARVLGDIASQTETVVTGSDNWVGALNELLDRVIRVIFQPRYSMAFAGGLTMVIMAVFMFIKVQQCDDLECKFAQLSNDEINSYLDNKSDSYADEVFEMNLESKSLETNPNLNNVHAYKDALKDVDDDALNNAIAD